MSLQLEPVSSIPNETVRVAKASFPKGSTYIRMRDELGMLYSDEVFAALFSRRGQPAIAPARLALVTVMQYAEGLTDRQAADAVRSRIDWKYALGLELTDPGFDFSVLSEFRSRLIDGSQERQLLDLMLSRFVEKGLLKSPKQQRTDSTHILAAIRTLSRLENIGETLRHALNTLAVVAPNWLRSIVPNSEWYERYARKFEDSRLPYNREERTSEAIRIGADGIYLLDAIWSEVAPSWLRLVEAVEILRLVWLQQFYVENNVVQLRGSDDYPSSSILINSPYDLDARRGNKRTTIWTGYKVHLSETCDQDAPHLITYVETTPTSDRDHQVLDELHHNLAQRDILPEKHFVDTGYVEGTISQATRVFGLRRCRYRGFEKTRLQHIITAAAMNLVRVWQWWTETNNFGKSISRFAAIAA